MRERLTNCLLGLKNVYLSNRQKCCCETVNNVDCMPKYSQSMKVFCESVNNNNSFGLVLSCPSPHILRVVDHVRIQVILSDIEFCILHEAFELKYPLSQRPYTAQCTAIGTIFRTYTNAYCT